MSLRGLAKELAAGECSPTELLEQSLARIQSAQPELNAFRLVRPDAAREEAAEAERRLLAGERLPLLGVPIAIKDDVDLVGEPTAFGCPGQFPPARADAAAVAKLKAAGAVIVGKTNSPEIGLWPFTEGPAFGVTRNPWSRDHTPGGSSGGSAAAVAAGMVEAAVGSDGAGSIRIPAAWNHLVGIKPQRGRVSTMPEAEAFNGLTVIGPLARNVADAALMLDVLSGNLDGDRHRPPAHHETFATAATRSPGSLRIALALNVPFSGAPAELDPAIRAQVERLATVLESLGHQVEVAEVPYGLLPGASLIPRSMIGIEEWVGRVPDRAELDHRVLEAARTGRLLKPLLGISHLLEQIARRRIGRVFARHDVVLSPTTAQPPLPIDACKGLSAWQTDKAIVAACPYAWPWNVLGWPGINVPAGFTDSGLPIGAQLLGPANSEPRLIALAAQLEEVESWPERQAPLRAEPELAA
jgi:amidase